MSARWLHAASGASLFALLTFAAIAWTRHVDTERAERYGQTLRTWLALEFRLSAEVLRARAGMVGHYDGIVQTQAARKRILTALSDVPEFLSDAGSAQLRHALAEAERSRVDTERLVEHFKSEHAVLRTSLRYLPLLAAELAGSDGRDPVARGLVQDALLLLHSQDPAIAQRIDTSLVALERERDAAPEARRTALDALILHARTVRERTPRVYQLTASILAASSADRAQRTTDAFAAQLRVATQTAETDGLILLVLMIASGALVAANIILRMRWSAAALRRTGAELQQAVLSLRAEQAKQRELSELKTRFVSMTSHEFRTPLSVIMSSAEMLEAYADRWPAHKKAEHFERVRAAALGMTRMLESILMIGRSDAGALRCEPQPLELGSFCADVVASMTQANSDCRRIVYEGPSRPEPVCADRVLLRQVLENLLSNALKYSPDAAEVLCQVARHDGELCLRVIDHGIGISDEDQQHLFETFHRGKNVGGIAGSGLGLAVVGRAVQLHGGSVSVRSELGVGSEFTVRIPYVEAQP
ncbi:MAG TPA: DAHL domain-containing protein [Polyangiales bacterium]|nr:DAHL domain-containing protein [Polyangiales bacterium]